MKPRPRQIELGAMADPLSKQLRGLGMKRFAVKMLDADANAITRLHLRGLLTDAESTKARMRLIKLIERKIKIWSKQ